MDEATTYLAPALGVVAADNDDIGRHPQVAQGAMQTHRLLGLVSDLRLDNEKVDVAMGSGLPSRMRAEEDHLRVRGSRSQTASRLGD